MKKFFKRFFKAVLILLFILFIIAVAKLGMLYLMHRFPSPKMIADRVYTTNNKGVTVELAGHNYFLPNNYDFGGVKEKEGDIVKGMLLQVLWPNMEPRTAENMDEFRLVPGWGKRITILLKNKDRFKKYPDAFARIYEMYIDTYVPVKEKPDIYGLKYKMLSRHSAKGEDIGDRSDTFRQELYEEWDDGKLITFISCWHLVEAPGCKHKFEYNEILYNLSYSRKFLPKWKEIQQATVDLMNDLEEKAKMRRLAEGKEKLNIYKVYKGGVNVILAGYEYFLPNNYNHSGEHEKDGDMVKRLVLQALWPDMEPKTPKNIDEFGSFPEWRRRITILLESKDRFKKYPDAFLRIYKSYIGTNKDYIGGNVPVKEKGNIYGLKYRITSFHNKQSEDIGYAKNRFRQELYEEWVDGRLESFISCEHLLEAPRCTHRFEYNNLIYKILYSKKFLPEWKDIKQ